MDGGPEVAFVQTPQYYANTEDNRIAAASWAQQALFFGAIAAARTASTRSSAAAPTCCSAARRSRASAGFPTNSLTEDFELSIHLHEKGWSSAYIPDVLSRGLGPEDTASYVSQQQRWARGCLSGIPRALQGEASTEAEDAVPALGPVLPLRLDRPDLHELPGRPAPRRRPADRRHRRAHVPLHFVPYYAVALTMAAVAGAGSYTFSAFALSAANFWIHVLSTIYTVLRKSGSFVVTPKKGAEARQPGAVMPALVAVGVLVAASVYGLAQQPGRRDDQQRLVRRRAHHDSHDRMLGRAAEAARAGVGFL